MGRHIGRWLALGIAALVCSTAASADAANEKAPGLDLRKLAEEGRMPAAIDISIKDDTVYRKPMRYRGYPLRAVLGLIPDLESLRKEGSEVVFTADDGYVATMALDDALTGNGLIAFRDLDAPAGKDWQPFKQGKETTTPGPFYVVWPNQDPDDWAYPWPYQLATIDVVPFSEAYGKAMPDGGDARVRKGFNVFRTYCLKCHSVNLAGGELAPELNVPKNVTEYWDRDVLAAFVGDVPSFRAGSKMPSFVGLLTHEDIDLALDYLVHMASQKVCSTAESCEAMVE